MGLHSPSVEFKCTADVIYLIDQALQPQAETIPLTLVARVHTSFTVPLDSPNLWVEFRPFVALLPRVVFGSPKLLCLTRMNYLFSGVSERRYGMRPRKFSRLDETTNLGSIKHTT